jgi:hypothetical protein
VGLGAVFGRIDRWIGTFNRWFGGAAVAASAQHPGAGGAPVLDPTAVVAALGELEREADSETGRRDESD